MNIYVPLALILVIFCFILRNSKKHVEKFFLLSMLVTFIFIAIRYEFGPDYFSYRDIFFDIKSGGLERRAESEPLFYYYLYSFPKYTLFLVFNSLLWFVSYYLFFKKYVNGVYYWIILLFLFFNTDCILNATVAMRSAVCAFLFIIAFHYLQKGKKIIFLAILVSCVFIHTSSIALLPLALINDRRNSILFSKVFSIVVLALTILSLAWGHNSIIIYLSTFLTESVEDFGKYAQYIEDMSGANTLSTIVRHAVLKILCLIPFLYLMFTVKNEEDKSFILIYKFAIITSALSLVFGQGMMSRYYMILNPFYITALIRSIRYSKPGFSALVLFCVLFSSVFMFYNTLQADYCVSFKVYHSILSAPSIP